MRPFAARTIRNSKSSSALAIRWIRLFRLSPGCRPTSPRSPSELVVSADEIGPNPKVNTLNNMLPQASHEILLMLDSDIRVGPDFIKAISAELPPDEGLLTCLYRAGEAPGTPSKLEAVGISSEFAPGVLVAQMAGGISFAFGAAIAVSKKTLDDHRRIHGDCSLSGR